MPEQAHLRIHGHGGVEVEAAIAFLNDLKRAYDSILLFETVIDQTRRAARDFPFLRDPFASDFGWLLASRGSSRRRYNYWPPTPEGLASSVPRGEQLILSAVSLHSPGFWEFMGTLNPLEVLRKYLNDRHERKKDSEYRDSAERRRLELENLSLQTRIISERVRIAKDIGATDRALAPLLNELIYKPLTVLNRHQDNGTIEYT